MTMYLKLSNCFLFIIISIFAHLSYGATLNQLRDISVTEVGDISLDGVGILTENNGGLPYNAYKSSDYAFLRTLLLKISLSSPSAFVTDLKKRVLLSKTASPSNNPVDTSFFTTRLKHLSLAGDYKTTLSLIDLIPKDKRSLTIKRFTVIAPFIANDYDQACARVQNDLLGNKDIYTHQSVIVCKYVNNKVSEGELAISLGKEDGFEFSPEFLDILPKLNGNEEEIKKAKEQWIEHIINSYASLDQLDYDFPPLKRIYTSPLSTKAVVNWWHSLKQEDDATRIHKAAAFYKQLSSLNIFVRTDEWQSFILYSASKHFTPPMEAIEEVLKDAAQNGRIGEVALLILYALGDKHPSAMPVNSIATMINALNTVGLVAEAKQLAEEAITGNGALQKTSNLLNVFPFSFN